MKQQVSPVLSKQQHIIKNKANEVSGLMVPCLNCEELVHVDDIDKHSQKCTSVSKKVIQLSKSQQAFEEIDFKITRLRDSLMQLIGQVRTHESLSRNTEQKMKYLYRASEIAEGVVAIKTIGSADERRLKDIEQELRILSEQYSGSLGVALYIERLHSLVLQKVSICKKQQNITQGQINNGRSTPNQTLNNISFQSPPPKNNISQLQAINAKAQVFSSKQSVDSQKDKLKAQLAEKRAELDNVRATAQIYRQRNNLYQQTFGQYNTTNTTQGTSQQQTTTIDHLTSPPASAQGSGQPRNFNYLSPEVNDQGRLTLVTKISNSNLMSFQNSKAQKSEILTQLSSSQFGCEIDTFQMNGDNQFNNDRHAEQTQRAFYSKCLNLKMKLPQNHPGQKVPAALLYKEAQKKGLQPQQWETYIKQFLNSPSEYTDTQQKTDQQFLSQDNTQFQGLYQNGFRTSYGTNFRSADQRQKQGY